MSDRIGLRWSAELATEIVASLGRFDLLEVIADEFFEAAPRRLRALQTLAREVPVALHGVGLGLASLHALDERRLARVSRLVERVRPQAWSEHLALARAVASGGAEGAVRLVAPPRTAASAEATSRNLERAAKLVGLRPFVENVAGSAGAPPDELDAAAWLRRVLSESSSDLLLDLHQLNADAIRSGLDARAVIAALPPGRIRFVHAGSEPGAEHRSASRPHREADPLGDAVLGDDVLELLSEVGRRASRPVSVILELDGPPPMDRLLGELARARAALAEGRRRAVSDAEAVA